MGFSGLIHFGAIALVLFAFLVAGSESKPADDMSSYRLRLHLGDTNDELEELFWIHCGVDLICAKKISEDLESYLSKKTIKSLKKENSRKAMLADHPKIEQTLLECLQKKNRFFVVRGEEGQYKTSYAKLLELAISERETSRYRRRNLLQSSVVSPESATDEKTQNDDHIKRIVGIAIGITAGVTFIFAALLFLCYKKGCLGRAGGRKNGSSDKPVGLGNSMNKAKVDNQSVEASVSNTKMTVKPPLNGHHNVELGIQNNSKAEAQSLGDIAAVSKISPGNSSEGSSVTRPSPPHPPSPPTFVYPRPPPQGPPPPQPGMKTGPTPPPPPRNSAPPPRPSPSGMKAGPPPPSLPRNGAPPPRPPPPTFDGPLPPPQGPPPPQPGTKAGPPPPPLPRNSPPPPRPPPPGMGSKSLQPPHRPSSSRHGGEPNNPKTKLKPFFWDKVPANSDQSMVWHQIRSGSFQFNEKTIETLFGFAPAGENINEPKKQSPLSHDTQAQYIQIIDYKKAQNLSILLKALNVTSEEVCDALQEGNELPPELLQTLLKMAPTTEEELKLRLYNGELSRLRSADRFLKVLVDIPFAFKRLESLLFMCTLEEEALMIKDSLATLEAACTQLKNSRLFHKLLEAVLKTGNRMNDGTFRGGAQAFKLDTLLKLSDVKGTDGKTTLLHFVVQEIIRSEGIRATRLSGESKDSADDLEEHYRSLGLQVISSLNNELDDVKKAAVLDSDSITGAVSKLGYQLVKSRDFLNTEMKNVNEKNGFNLALKSFVQDAEVDITMLLEKEKRVMALAKNTADYFHGKAGKEDELRLFIVVRDFLIMLDKVCKEVQEGPGKQNKTVLKGEGLVGTIASESQKSPDLRQKLFPTIRGLRVDSSSSGDEAWSE